MSVCGGCEGVSVWWSVCVCLGIAVNDGFRYVFVRGVRMFVCV